MIPLHKIKYMPYIFQNKEYQITRYPKTKMTSLKAWNASDELILEYLEENKLLSTSIVIYHDRFGFLSTILADKEPISVILFQSQKKSILQNLQENNISTDQVKFIYPLEALQNPIQLSVIKIPKSADLFELYLQQLSTQLNDNSIVIAGFMTKYFSKQVIDIAHKYFADVSQSKAKRKARLLILKKPKNPEQPSLVKIIKLNTTTSFQQYYGVFSAKNIDYASQFLMEHISVLPSDSKILDMGTGNGVLAWKARQLSATAKINLHDDNWLALESAKLNMKEGENFYHFDDDLLQISNNSYDLVISNPPFHFEYETNIEVSLSLFEQVWKILKPRGRFQLVGNRHLNYKTHLQKIFPHVEIIAENDKFIVYSCVKT